VSIQFGPEWQQFDQRLQRTPEQMSQDMRRTITQSLLWIEADARAMAPHDTRRMAGSIVSRVTGLYPNLVGQVGPSTRYGYFVEFGRRPGRMPPADALIGWVRRHWHPISARRRGISESTLRSQAFVLARAIGRRGTRAQPFLGPAFQRNRVRIEQAFERIGVHTVAYLSGRPL